MPFLSSPWTARSMVVAAALGVAALAGLAPASCALDTEGKAPASPTGGGGTPGSGGAGGVPGTGGGGGVPGTGGGGAPASSTTGGGQGGTGGAGGGPVEDCLNGSDDDADGDVDCADADCGPVVECVDPAPGGWNGSLRVAQGPYPAVDQPPTCAGGSAAALYYSGPAGPAQCAMCDCMFTGATCTTPQLTCWFDVNNCSGSVDVTYQGNDNSCVGTPPLPSNNTGSCGLTGPSQLQGAGTCQAMNGQIINSATWGQEVYVCTAPESTGGCLQGQVCVPKAPMGFADTACITRGGIHACPGGWTGSEITVYTGGTDTRDCTGCACNVAGVTCTGGSLTLYNHTNCTDATQTIDMVCEDASNMVDNGQWSYQGTPGTPTPGTCTQPTPTGNLTVMGQATICCSQPIP